MQPDSVKNTKTMRKIVFTLLCLTACVGMHAEVVKLNGLYYSLGTTTAQVVADQTSDKSVYSAYTTVTIPATVTYNNYTYAVNSIATSAFESCSNLTSFVVDKDNKFFDSRDNCNALINTRANELVAGFNITVIPNTVTKIGANAFQGSEITSIVIPNSVTNSQITSFVLGDSVQTIPSYLCYGMTRLDTVVLPPSVRSLGQHAFHGCTSLKSINLPVTQKTLPVSFLEYCSSLETIQLPTTLTTISQDAFYGCVKLTNVTLHEGLTTIGARAFYNCKLSNITIPSTVTSIGNGAFKGNPTTSVTWLPANCSTGTGSDAPFYNSSNSQITSFVLGDSVQTIPAYLCQGMNRLDSIVLPESVTTIGSYAFYSCSALRSINLPAAVNSVGQRAFSSCTSLKEMAFPQGMTVLATSVLEDCTALEQVVIPASVTTINQDAFYNCSELRAIYNYAFTPQTIVARTMYNVNKNTCILYVPMDYIDLYQTKAVWCDFQNIVGMATDLQFEEQLVQVSYLKHDSTLHYMEVQNWQIPHAPRIEGFTFLKWQVLPGDLADGIVLRAVYTANQPTSAPAVYTNPANPAEKLIRNGNVYILTGEKEYTITGQQVR